MGVTDYEALRSRSGLGFCLRAVIAGARYGWSAGYGDRPSTETGGNKRWLKPKSRIHALGAASPSGPSSAADIVRHHNSRHFPLALQLQDQFSNLRGGNRCAICTMSACVYRCRTLASFGSRLRCFANVAGRHVKGFAGNWSGLHCGAPANRRESGKRIN